MPVSSRSARYCLVQALPGRYLCELQHALGRHPSLPRLPQSTGQPPITTKKARIGVVEFGAARGRRVVRGVGILAAGARRLGAMKAFV
jgi:hypothetical protein